MVADVVVIPVTERDEITGAVSRVAKVKFDEVATVPAAFADIAA
jgi:hypothetical protein